MNNFGGALIPDHDIAVACDEWDGEQTLVVSFAIDMTAGQLLFGRLRTMEEVVVDIKGYKGTFALEDPRFEYYEWVDLFILSALLNRRIECC